MIHYLTDKEVREKLVSRGVESLSDAELVGLIIQEGSFSVGCSTETAAKVINASGGNLGQMARLDLKGLRAAEGLGIKKAAMLTAAFELGGRVEQEKYISPITIRNNEDVERMFRPQLSNLKHEEFWVLFLSTANTVLGKSKVSQG